MEGGRAIENRKKLASTCAGIRQLPCHLRYAVSFRSRILGLTLAETFFNPMERGLTNEGWKCNKVGAVVVVEDIDDEKGLHASLKRVMIEQHGSARFSKHISIKIGDLILGARNEGLTPTRVRTISDLQMIVKAAQGPRPLTLEFCRLIPTVSSRTYCYHGSLWQCEIANVVSSMVDHIAGSQKYGLFNGSHTEQRTIRVIGRVVSKMVDHIVGSKKYTFSKRKGVCAHRHTDAIPEFVSAKKHLSVERKLNPTKVKVVARILSRMVDHTAGVKKYGPWKRGSQPFGRIPEFVSIEVERTLKATVAETMLAMVLHIAGEKKLVLSHATLPPFSPCWSTEHLAYSITFGRSRLGLQFEEKRENDKRCIVVKKTNSISPLTDEQEHYSLARIRRGDAVVKLQDADGTLDVCMNQTVDAVVSSINNMRRPITVFFVSFQRRNQKSMEPKTIKRLTTSCMNTMISLIEVTHKMVGHLAGEKRYREPKSTRYGFWQIPEFEPDLGADIPLPPKYPFEFKENQKVLCVYGKQMFSASIKKVKEVETHKSTNSKVLEWVQCSLCTQWRTLPEEVSAESLPETWTCDLNVWDTRYGTCAAPQEDPDESQVTKTLWYFIHFSGWKSIYDVWVEDKYVFQDTPVNRKLQQEMEALLRKRAKLDAQAKSYRKKQLQKLKHEDDLAAEAFLRNEWVAVQGRREQDKAVCTIDGFEISTVEEDTPPLFQHALLDTVDDLPLSCGPEEGVKRRKTDTQSPFGHALFDFSTMRNSNNH